MTNDRAGIVKPEIGMQARSFGIGGNDFTIEGAVVYDVPIASNIPVTRTFGQESLVITEDAIEMSSEIPLLLNHNPNDRKLGSVRNAKIIDGVLKADIVFDEEYHVAREILASLRAGFRQDLSIGYIPRKTQIDRMGESLAESHLVTNYSIVDCSVVGRGADIKAGFGRSAEGINDVDNELTTKIMTTAKDNKIDDANVASDEKTVDTRNAQQPEVIVKDLTESQKKSERAAVMDLFTLAETHNIDMATAKGWVNDGITLTEAKDQVLNAISKRSAETPVVRFADVAPREDEKQYKDGNVELSFRGAIDFLVSNQLGDGNFSPEASLARDVSKQLGGGSSTKLRVPFGALSKRSFEASDAKQGQNIIQDTVRMDEFQKFLYNNTVSGKLGLKQLTGLVDNVVIPRQTKSNAASYNAESAAASYTDMEADNVKIEPHTAIAITRVTNLAKAQMPGIQSLLQDDLLSQLRIAVDRTTLIGGGSNEPTGIMATTGVTTARSGNTGAATRKYNIENVLDALTAIQNSNVMGSPKIVAPPSVINYWRKQKDSDGQYLWSANTDMSTVMDNPGFLWGSPVYVSTNLRNSGDAATDHRVLIGVFDYAYMAFFGNSFNLEIGTSGNDFASDQASIRAVVYHDAAVARTAAFKGISKIEV